VAASLLADPVILAECLIKEHQRAKLGVILDLVEHTTEAIATLLGSGALTPLGIRFVELMRQPARSVAPQVPG
jgi:hypothetical protein